MLYTWNINTVYQLYLSFKKALIAHHQHPEAPCSLPISFCSTGGHYYLDLNENHLLLFLVVYYLIGIPKHYSYIWLIIEFGVNGVIWYIFFWIRLFHLALCVWEPSIFCVHRMCFFFTLYSIPLHEYATVYLSALLWIGMGILPLWGY